MEERAVRDDQGMVRQMLNRAVSKRAEVRITSLSEDLSQCLCDGDGIRLRVHVLQSGLRGIILSCGNIAGKGSDTWCYVFWDRGHIQTSYIRC